MKNRIHINFFLATVCSFFSIAIHAQSITGVWRGKITQQKFGKTYHVELKLIRNGDSLTGTSYYYASENNYYRYSVKGYFDPYSGDVIWWDQDLIESKSPKRSGSPDDGLRYAADFNCPGEGIMKLDGNAEKKNGGDKPMDVHLNKVKDPIFGDDWDFVIENFALGANDPAIIDSVDLAQHSPNVKAQTTVAEEIPNTPIETKQVAPVAIATQPPKQRPQPTTDLPKQKPVAETKPIVTAPQSIEDKFVTRKKILVTEIPVVGDSIELNFYDHAEIDGDSISLFLNNKLLHEHILLKATPFSVKLPTSELQSENELIMVAENLGSIPPNTSLMIAYVNGQRYEARLESTENSSAMIRFVKPPK